MKIAQVLDSLDVGGAEVMASALCQIYQDMGHSVTVHCLYGSGPLADVLLSRGIPVFVHGPSSAWKRASSLYRQFFKLAPDVVHCHNAATTIQAAPVAKAARVKVVLSTRHGLVQTGRLNSQELKYSIAAALFCDYVVAVCDATRRNLMANLWAPRRVIVTVRNGAAPAPLGGATLPPSRGSAFTVVNVGRLVPEKDQATLLRAVALASRNVPDLRLLLVGDGPRKPNLKVLAAELHIADRVCFAGEQVAVGEYLRQSDVFILSSISEGMPISLLEAMAAGKPAIVTRIGAMPEIIQLSRAGSVVEARDPESLARCIVSYAQQRSQLDRLGQNARATYETYFTPERVADEYLHLYHRAIGTTARSRRLTYAAR